MAAALLAPWISQPPVAEGVRRALDLEPTHGPARKLLAVLGPWAWVARPEWPLRKT